MGTEVETRCRERERRRKELVAGDECCRDRKRGRERERGAETNFAEENENTENGAGNQN